MGRNVIVRTADTATSVSSLSAGSFASHGRLLSPSGGGATISSGSNKSLYGRKAECAILREAFDRISSKPNAQSEVVFVHGESGSGKSTIVETTLRRYSSRNDFGYYASGKFDQLRGNEPYSAIVEAFTDLIDLIQQGNNPEAMREKIREELNGDIAMFSQLVGHSAFFGTTTRQLNHEDDSTEPPTEKAGQTLVRLKLACRSFLRVVASAEHPVVLFIDDLQFSGDRASLKVIESMMTDSESVNVLIVAAFRDNEEHVVRHLKECITLIGEPGGIASLPVTNVHVSNLDITNTNELISDVLNLDPSASLSLTGLVLRKTHGNVYHILHYIEFLKSEQLLLPSEEDGGSRWDLQRISAETDVSDNVVDLLSKKMERLTTELQSTLKYAACIGCRFDFGLLARLVQQECFGSSALTHNMFHTSTTDAVVLPGGADDSTRDNSLLVQRKLSRVLAQAVKEGLVEEHSERCYKWAHDRIQQYIYNGIGISRRDSLHLMIGGLIMKDAESSSSGSDALVCSAVDQLIRGSSSVRQKDALVTMSRHCLSAAKIAISKSAYSSACEYLGQGISCLKTSGTAYHVEYTLTLELHTLAAEMEYYCGNFDSSTRIGNTVLEQGRSLEDKMRVYYCFISSLGSRGMADEALSVGFSVLALLGEPLRISKLQLFKEQKVLLNHLRRMSDGDILCLPRMTDHKKKAATRILNSMAYYAYWKMDFTRFAPITVRMMKILCDMGLDVYSAPALANYALWNQIVGRNADAYRFAMLAIRVLRQLNARQVEASTLSIVYGFVMHWRRPLYEGICPFERCVENGLRVGDLDSTFSGCNGLLVSYLFSASMELGDLQEELRQHCYRLKDYSEKYFALFVLPLYQLVMCLCGDVDDPRELCGTALDGKAQYEKFRKERNIMCLKIVALNQLQLALYFGDWETLARLLPQLQRSSKRAQVHLVSCVSRSLTALSHYIVYEKNRNRRNLRAARKQSREVHKWVKQGNVNCEPVAALLNAEEVRRKSIDVMGIKEAYDTAIDVAARMDFTHIKAMSAERAGSAMTELGHANRAAYYLRQSITSYDNWGAKAKVWEMEKLHKCYYRASG